MGIAASIGRSLKQSGTYWAPSTINKYGDPSFVSPVAVTVRWESKNVVFTDKDGEQSHSKAVVYCTTSLAVDGYLYLGTSSTANPESVSGADRIRRVDADPSVKATSTLYKAYL